MSPKSNGLPSEPLWYKDAIFYELRVRSFYDANGDGIGDFAGLTQKLDYLQDLGVTTLWLLPFYPSPMRDDGYDTADYTDVQPECGTLEDFQAFLDAAHARGLRVVTELVLNHTSDQHPWFQRARRAPAGSPERDFYVWSDTTERYKEARIIFQDFEPSNWSWDPVANAYYWHRFFSHQPDLNFENPAVHAALFEVVDFWFNLGVDGLRLDAVPYLYEADGTSCENLAPTHAFLKKLRAHVDETFTDRMLLAEANQWPEDAVAYLEGGVECHMAFHFPLMPRLFMAVRMEDRFPITDIWAQTPNIDPSCQWALFLRNHDELTLEMVTEEERDFMYRAYAHESRMRINLGIRRRLAPLLGNDRRTIELKNALLLSLPGTPVLYYGDEIGMGDNVYLGDRDGVRTPMQWSSDRNAGFSKANPQKLILPVVIDIEYHYQTVNVEAQEQNRNSLLWWMRRLVSLRKQHQAFGRGSIEFLSPDASSVLAFVRTFSDEKILVVANLSRFPQAASLDLSRFSGLVPVELFGRSAFPTIAQAPYVITLGEHAFHWFSLEAPRTSRLTTTEVDATLPQLGGVQSLAAARSRVEGVLPAFLVRSRWFGSKTRVVKGVSITESFAMPGGATLALVDVQYQDGDSERYALPLVVLSGDAAHQARSQSPERAICELSIDGVASTLFDAVADQTFAHDLLALVDGNKSIRGLRGHATRLYPELRGDGPLEPKLLRAEQSNSSIAYGERMIIKMLRHVEAGRSPEVEIGEVLAKHGTELNVASTAGWIELTARGQEPQTIAVLQQFVPNQGDAWQYTHAELMRFYERAVTNKGLAPSQLSNPIDLLGKQPSKEEHDLIGAYLDAALLMGQRTAELHRALASEASPAFKPEAYTSMYQRSHYQSLRNLGGQVFRTLRSRLHLLAPGVRDAANDLLQHGDAIERVFEQFIRRRMTALRIRCHGDLHLGQLLYTGKDFVIVDFEGEPARSLEDRRRKRGALRDVAGMLRSFHYASLYALLEARKAGTLADKDVPAMLGSARMWQSWVTRAFVKAYLDSTDGASFMPRDADELRVLLDVFLLEKALYELRYELNNRPDWVAIPLEGVRQILGLAETAELLLGAASEASSKAPMVGGKAELT